MRFLHSLEPHARRAHLAELSERVDGLVLAEAMVRQATASLPDSSQESRSWARLTMALLDAQPPSTADVRTHAALRARAMALDCNVSRIEGRIAEAVAGFTRVHQALSEAAVTDLSALAEVHWLEALLERDRRHLARAEQLVQLAQILWRATGQRAAAAKAGLSHLSIVLAGGDEERALKLAHGVEVLLRGSEEPQLLLMARHNRAWLLARLGRTDEAAQFLNANRDLYDRFPKPWFTLRRRWLEALIAAGRGDLDSARTNLQQIRQGFAAEEAPYDAALVDLELALLELEAGDLSEARRLGRELVDAFRALGIDRETLMALQLLETVQRQETALSVLDALRLTFRRLETRLAR